MQEELILLTKLGHLNWEEVINLHLMHYTEFLLKKELAIYLRVDSHYMQVLWYSGQLFALSIHLRRTNSSSYGYIKISTIITLNLVCYQLHSYWLLACHIHFTLQEKWLIFGQKKEVDIVHGITTIESVPNGWYKTWINYISIIWLDIQLGLEDMVYNIS